MGGRPRTAALPLPPSGPPVRSVTIDLGDAAGTRPLTENAPAAAPVAPPAAAAAPRRCRRSAPPRNGGHAACSRGRAAGGSGCSANARAAAAPAATAAASNSHGGTVQSGWTVQLGSFSRREFADRMVKDAAAKGFTVEVAGPDDRGLYRVRSPPRADRAAALALKQKMQASGYQPIVNKAP